MAEPIANDWKAVRDRIQQIRAEQSAILRQAPTPVAPVLARRWTLQRIDSERRKIAQGVHGTHTLDRA
jgi:hypothetical protein